MLRDLHRAIAEVAPVSGLTIGRGDDRATWRVDFAPGATEQQKAAAQAVIDGFDSLALVKRDARQAIDAAAEAARLKHITTGAGMALTYQRKSVERMGVLSAKQAGATVTKDLFPMLYASVGVEVPKTGDDAADIEAVAVLIGQRELGFAAIGAEIERRRLVAKKAVADASSEQAVRAATLVEWP